MNKVNAMLINFLVASSFAIMFDSCSDHPKKAKRETRRIIRSQMELKTTIQGTWEYVGDEPILYRFEKDSVYYLDYVGWWPYKISDSNVTMYFNGDSFTSRYLIIKDTLLLGPGNNPTIFKRTSD